MWARKAKHRCVRCLLGVKVRESYVAALCGRGCPLIGSGCFIYGSTVSVPGEMG